MHQRFEIAALEQLHHVIEAAVVGGAEIEQPDGVLRPQQRRGLRFALEAAQLRLRRGIGGAEGFELDQLHRRIAREQAVARPPHRAHPAGAELLDQLIAAKLARLLRIWRPICWNIADGSVATPPR